MPDLPHFRDRALLTQALTHKSYINETLGIGENNERLEFLGDAILTFLIGDMLYRRFPNQSEGDLTQMRASMVDKTHLAAIATALNLGPQLRMGKGVEGSNGRNNSRLLCSTFEAVIGAYYLDCDTSIEPVRQYIEPLFEAALQQRRHAGGPINVKGACQTWALEHLGKVPNYEIVGASGPDHDKQFVAEVSVTNTVYGTGAGRKKQDAEKAAARDALRKLGLI